MYGEKIASHGGIEESETLEKKMDFWLKCQCELSLLSIGGKRILGARSGTESLTPSISQGKNEEVAIGNSPVCLDRGKRKVINATFLLADICIAYALHDHHDLFDSAIMSDVLEDVEKQDHALEVVFSLLRKNGVLILTVPAF